MNKELIANAGLLNIDKLIEVVGYILKKYNNQLNYTKLLKMLYLADRQAYNDIGSSITGDTYAAMPKGPVLSITYDLIRNKRYDVIQAAWNNHFSVDNKNLVLNSSDLGFGKLSDYELSVLDNIDAQFHNCTFGQMIDYVHKNCPEWQDPNGSSYPIYPQDILRSLGKTQEEIDFLTEEEAIYTQEEKELACLDNT